MQANRIETEAMGALRTALHHPQTGFASRPPTERLAALPGIQATLDGIGETFRAQATTPRQRAILGPLLDNHLEHAATQVGRLAEQALGEADDGIVEDRIGGLQQDAAVNWDDPARLRILGRAVVTERRSQGERRGWGKDETEGTVRQNVSDFYAVAIEAAKDRDLDRAGKLLTDAQGVLLPERQVLLARKLAEARDDKHVAGIAGTLAAIPLDPASPPTPEAYRARAEELTPDDATPELRARIAQLADTAQRHATKYWQHDRNQAGLAAIDWMVSNPGAPVVTMDRKIVAQLSPDQRARLQEIETTGRLDTDPGVYDELDRLAIYDPKAFAATDLSQYRLALDGKDYARFTAFQKGDIAFARYDRGRTVLDAGLIKAQFNSDGPEARAARGELDKTLRSFETIEGRPPTMADIDRVAGDIVQGEVEIAQQQEAQQRPSPGPVPAPKRSPSPSATTVPAPQSLPTPEPGRGYGTRPQAGIEKGMTRDQIKINREQAFRELTRQPLGAKDAVNALPGDWETTKPSEVIDDIKRAAERHGVPVQLLARLLYQEGKFGERDKLSKSLRMKSGNDDHALGYAQITTNTVKDLQRWAGERGDTKRSEELAAYSPDNREKAFDVAAELLAYQYRLLGGSWPKAVGAYSLGRNGLKGWLDGDQSYDPNNTRAKWREISTYLAYVLKGGDSDPHLGDMYRYEPPNGGRTSVKVGRSTTAPYPRSTVSDDPKENP